MNSRSVKVIVQTRLLAIENFLILVKHDDINNEFMANKDKKIIKSVDPQGLILNDNDTGVDHLDQTAYAEAIAESIHQVETPITIGLFARWGSGKSFLVKHILSALRKYEKQAEQDARDVAANATRRSLCSVPRCSAKWAIGVVMMLFLVAFLGSALTLAIYPELFTRNSPEVQNKEKTTTTLAPTVSITATTFVDPQIATATVRYIGLSIFIFLIILTVLVTCCSQWVSKSYYGQLKLLMYAMFTKIPITKDSSEYVINDPGETDSNLLKRADPDEVVKAASVSNAVFPRKYIFVNFRAWEFAGSDTLWAGIVTNLASAIEAEFGPVTSRLFRITNFEDLPPSDLIRAEEKSRVIYVDLYKMMCEDADGNLQSMEVKDAMQQYGVVKKCNSITPKNWWEVEFEQTAEARNAYDCLSIEGVMVSRDKPVELQPNIERLSGGRESRRPLLPRPPDEEEVIEAVEMEELNAVPESAGKNIRIMVPNKDGSEELIEYTREDGRCGRFCSHWSKHPSMLCCCPYLLWVILATVCLIVLPIAIYLFAEIFHLQTARTFWAVSTNAQILLWVPGALSVVVFGMRFLWAMCNSQRSRVSRALNGTNSKMAAELGFMRKVKNEVAIMTKLIHCARFVFRRDYKVVISVDDVDRVALDKVKSVLEAVNILLSDRSSPFVCLIALDSRVAVKCIEESLGEALVQANVTGHEYLKKIINLPVCLPRIENVCKRRFIAGLIDQADHTTNVRKQDHKRGEKSAKRGGERMRAKSEIGDEFDGEESLTGEDDEQGKKTREKRFIFLSFSLLGHLVDKCVEEVYKIPDKDTMDGKAFMYACREFIYNTHKLHRFLDGSPRNIKRIFNVISLTGCIIRRQLKQLQRKQVLTMMQEKVNHENAPACPNNILNSPYGMIGCNEELVKDIVHWVVLTDQWPYRSSYILQVIEDSDQREEAGKVEERIKEDAKLCEIYEKKVFPELYMSERVQLGLDNDPDMLLNYLLYIKDTGLNKARTKQLAGWTINLDRSIRMTIAAQREKVVIDKYKKAT